MRTIASRSSRKPRRWRRARDEFPVAKMTALREQLVRFITALRSAGIRISVAESIDAMNAVAAAGIQRARMHEALAAAEIRRSSRRCGVRARRFVELARRAVGKEDSIAAQECRVGQGLGSRRG